MTREERRNYLEERNMEIYNDKIIKKYSNAKMEYKWGLCRMQVYRIIREIKEKNQDVTINQ